MLTAIIVVFVLGYLAIVFEHQIHINKAASAIVTGVLCRTIYAIGYDQLVPQAAFEAWEKLHAPGGDVHAVADANDDKTIEPWHRALFLALGLAGLMMVPIFKTSFKK